MEYYYLLYIDKAPFNSTKKPSQGEIGFSEPFDKAQSTFSSWAEINPSRRIVLAE